MVRHKCLRSVLTHLKLETNHMLAWRNRQRNWFVINRLQVRFLSPAPNKAYWLCLCLIGSVHYFYWLFYKKHRRVHTHSFGGRSNVGYAYLTFIWACSSDGRALPLQGRCRVFDSRQVHHKKSFVSFDCLE